VDFDDLATDTPPKPRRRRRPWWKWNLITLATVFFILIWARELIGLTAGWVSVAIALLTLAWVFCPLPFCSPEELSPLKAFLKACRRRSRKLLSMSAPLWKAAALLALIQPLPFYYRFATVRPDPGAYAAFEAFVIAVFVTGFSVVQFVLATYLYFVSRKLKQRSIAAN
jgi:hypothetical protein